MADRDFSPSTSARERPAEAIETLYAVFKRYRAPTVLAAAPHREPEKLPRQLTRVDLRDLMPEQVGSYAGWAMTTVGDENDYRHFFPRIFELAILQYPPWSGFEPCSVGRRLGYAGWRSWPKAEQEAIEEAFLAAWIYAINDYPDMESRQYPDEGTAIEWLEGIAIAGMNTRRALDLWLRSSPRAIARCADFVNEQLADRWLRDRLHRRFSHAEPEIRTVIKDWLLAGPVRDRLLEIAASGCVTAEDTENLLYAALILERLALQR